VLVDARVLGLVFAEVVMVVKASLGVRVVLRQTKVFGPLALAGEDRLCGLACAAADRTGRGAPATCATRRH
jgi:hypothetical protein